MTDTGFTSKYANTYIHRRNRLIDAVYETAQSLISNPHLSVTELANILNNNHVHFYSIRKWTAKNISPVFERLVDSGVIQTAKPHQQPKPKKDTPTPAQAKPMSKQQMLARAIEQRKEEAKDFTRQIIPVIQSFTKGDDVSAAKIAWILNRYDIKNQHGKNWTERTVKTTFKTWENIVAADNAPPIAKPDHTEKRQRSALTRKRSLRIDTYAQNIWPVF